MYWLKSLFYGFVCGLSEYLPISSSGHQMLFTGLFGSQIKNPISDLLIHLSLLAVIVFSNYSFIMRIRREIKSSSRRNGRERIANTTRYDRQLIKTASLPLVVVLFLLPATYQFMDNLLLLAAGFLINGVILFLPSRFMKGNKDAKNMSAADAFLIGTVGGLSVFSGISCIGASVSIASLRGADYRESLNWGFMLCIPALAVRIILDVIAIPGGNFISYSFWHYLLIILGTVAGGYLSIFTVRALSAKSGLSGFAFYSWGATLLALILYMIV